MAALDECLAAVTLTRSATEAKDWPNVQRLARRELELCNASKLPAYMRANSYSRLANAQFKLERYADALKAADDCVTMYYRSPTCHYLRYTSLVMLGRVDDALKEMQVARSVSNQILKEALTPSAVPIYQDWLQNAKQMARFVLKEISDEPESPRKK